MMDRVSLDFRAEYIAGSTGYVTNGPSWTTLYVRSRKQLQEAVDLAIEDITKVMK
jgi:hypothetical protein